MAIHASLWALAPFASLSLVFAAVEASEAQPEWAVDDEACSSADDAACALSLRQLRFSSVSSAAVVQPDASSSSSPTQAPSPSIEVLLAAGAATWAKQPGAASTSTNLMQSAAVSLAESAKEATTRLALQARQSTSAPLSTDQHRQLETALQPKKDQDGVVLDSVVLGGGGGGGGKYGLQPVPVGQAIQGSSLFCVMIYRPNSTEESLMLLAKKNGVSIFGCNESMALQVPRSGEIAQENGWGGPFPVLPDPPSTEAVLGAFKKIWEDGTFKKWDWTVKADPDVVFFADRLRGHLRSLRAPPHTPLYIKNPEDTWDPSVGNNGFLGLIEVFSNTAMLTMFTNAEACRKNFTTNGGEHGFFGRCVDALGIGFMEDANIFPNSIDPSCFFTERVSFGPDSFIPLYQCCVDCAMGLPRAYSGGMCTDDSSTQKRWWIHDD